MRQQLSDTTAKVLEMEASHTRLVTKRLEAAERKNVAEQQLGTNLDYFLFSLGVVFAVNVL